MKSSPCEYRFATCDCFMKIADREAPRSSDNGGTSHAKVQRGLKTGSDVSVASSMERLMHETHVCIPAGVESMRVAQRKSHAPLATFAARPV